MKQVFILMILFFSVSTTQSSSQDLNADSLIQQLKIENRDTALATIYWQLCKLYEEDKTDSALIFSRLSETFAVKANQPFMLARCLHERGICYDFTNQLDSCIYFLRKSDSIYTGIRIFDRKAAVIGDIGTAYFSRGNYELGLRYYFKAIELMKKYSPKKDLSKMLNNVGLIYKAKKDYTNAIQYYQHSLEIKKELHDEKGILNTTINIGSCFQRQNLFDSAYYFAHEALKMAEKLNLPKDILSGKVNMGAALASMKKNEEAFNVLRLCEKEAESKNVKSVLPTIYESLAISSRQTNQYRQSLQYYFKAYTLAQKSNSLELLATFSHSIAKVYAEFGLYPEAYRYLDSAKLFSDSLLNQENARQINEMTALYEFNEKEEAIHDLKNQNTLSKSLLRVRKRERNYFILSTILFLGLTGVAFNAYKQSRKKQHQLDEQKNIIAKSLSEKEILLKEIHHRVKNNLQIVSSLLSLQSNYIEDKQALDAVRESKNRVQSMAIIHQNLYQDESLVNINVKEYAEKLIEYLFHTYNIHDYIKLEMDIEELKMDVDTLVPLGLVLNELINNCLKYAFPNKHSGKIKVILKQTNGVLKLSVHDNGIGWQGSDSHFNQNSFGHKMIYAFMKKLKGELRIYDEDGTKVEIEIKNYKPIIG